MNNLINAVRKDDMVVMPIPLLTDIKYWSDKYDDAEDTSFESVCAGNCNNEGTDRITSEEGNDVTIDIAAAGATNSLIITDNVDAADPTFMISVTFDRDQN